MVSANGASTPDAATRGDEAATDTATPATLGRRRVFVAEITCLMCGREAGTAIAD
jgi:hypothetical protein